MLGLYALRRAGGEWYAAETPAGLHVPVFRSRADAFRARLRNWRMLFCKTAELDERAIKDLATREGEARTHFWLVDDPTARLESARSVDHGQLARLIYGVEEQGSAADGGLNA